MEELKNALSNKVYFDKDNNVIVKKYSQDKFKELFGNQEANILGKLGYKIVDLKQNEISIEYFNHEVWSDEDISLKDLTSLMNAINELHSLDIRGLEISGFKNVYYNLLLQGEYPIKGYYDSYEESISNRALAILEKEPLVCLHNDIVEGNILKVDSKIKLIDFEYSGLGNPIFDLASFLTERIISPSQAEIAISLFNATIDRKELLIVCAFLQIFWARWALYKYSISNKEIYKEIADWKLNEYNKLIEMFG